MLNSSFTAREYPPRAEAAELAFESAAAAGSILLQEFWDIFSGYQQYGCRVLFVVSKYAQILSLYTVLISLKVWIIKVPVSAIDSIWSRLSKGRGIGE